MLLDQSYVDSSFSGIGFGVVLFFTNEERISQLVGRSRLSGGSANRVDTCGFETSGNVTTYSGPSH
jgi:hypothetical protein